jgi:cytochrome c-type biogenesis protein CcmF
MIAEVGHYALVLALALAVIQSVVPLIGARTRDGALMAVAEPAALAQFAFAALSFIMLVSCYVSSDFSVRNVFENSHSQMPLIYKFTSTWGNHEGSMLLWVLILSLFGALVATFAANVPPTLKATVLAVQAWIAASFYVFILLTSNPFARMWPAPDEGRDLNPVLQDIGLAVHPPMLYLGYVGFSIAFSFAVAALIEGRIDAAWARRVRPWLLVAWICLTCGIAMGSYWAYYELGWGGWWFWDPVENASLMPWLVGTALLHSAVVMEKRDSLKVWTILLSILTFSLSLVGTFLVRSGVLQSVHAFASDPLRGTFILGILCLFILGSLTLFAVRAPLLRQGGLFAPVSREGALVLNNLFLTAACATVFVGTLYPMAYNAITGAAISVGAPFFNLTFGPVFVALLVIVPFGSLLAWKRGDLKGVAERLSGAFLVALIGLAATFALEGKPLLAPFGVGLALYVITGAITDLAERIGLLRTPLAVVWQRVTGLPRSAWGTGLAHMGLGITLLGIVGETQWGLERVELMKPGDRVALVKQGEKAPAMRNYEITFDRSFTRPSDGKNYSEFVASFTVRRHGEIVGVLEPSKRSFGSRQTTTTESALMARGVSQLYLSLGEVRPDGSVVVRFLYKPLVLLIWIGCLVMAAGGVFSLSDRRLRVGAPKPARARTAAAAVPAE